MEIRMRRMVLSLPISLCLTLAISLSLAAGAEGESNVHHIQDADRPIATGVWVGDTLYLSGQLASPVTPADAAKGTAAVYGDTEAQTMSTLTKIEDRSRARASPWPMW